MKITVLNGSPKGEISVTMQYTAYIQKLFPQHEYRQFNVAFRIKALEQNSEEFDTVIGAVRDSDVVIWAFPLYILHVHANYKRFIELVFERNAGNAFKDKYAASISTSIKFFDNIPNDYIQSVCDDLGMRYAGFYAAAMDDLFRREKREQLRKFAETLFGAAEHAETFCRRYSPITGTIAEYRPAAGTGSLDASSKKIVVVADELKPGSNLSKMVNTFRAQFARPVELIELVKEDIRGGCLGCCQCGYDNTCFWQGKDGFIDMYNSRLKTADIIIFAGEITDRYLSSIWKNFFDRSFFNTHQPSLRGKQIAFLVSGPLRFCDSARVMLQAWTEFQMSANAGFVSDEDNDSPLLDSQIRDLAAHCLHAAEKGYITTETFLRVGGMKVFRDDIYGHLRGVFQADHRYYRKNGFYDFPQKNIGSRLLNRLLLTLCGLKGFRDRMFKIEIKRGMIGGHKKIVDAAQAFVE